jgi:hypothetical protein
MKAEIVGQYLGIEYKISPWGNRYPIMIYYSSLGFQLDNRIIMCRTNCGNTAKYCLAIHNHLWEPQGSEYYCESCVPENHIPNHD